MVKIPLRHPGLFKALGLKSTEGIFLFGPPGTGKSLLAQAVAKENGAFFCLINGIDVLTKIGTGESLTILKNSFETAVKNAPAVVFINNIDAIAPKREFVTSHLANSNAASPLTNIQLTGSSAAPLIVFLSDLDSVSTNQIANTLLTELDSIHSKSNIISIGASKRPEIVDTAILRHGRLSRIIYMPLPDFQSRVEILKAKLRKSPTAKNIDLESVANETHRFTGSDLGEICQRACRLASQESIKNEISDGKNRDADPDALNKDDKPRADATEVQQRHLLEAMLSVERTVSDDDVRKYQLFGMSLQQGL